MGQMDLLFGGQTPLRTRWRRRARMNELVDELNRQPPLPCSMQQRLTIGPTT